MTHSSRISAALALADDLEAILDAGVPARHENAGAHEKGIAALDAAIRQIDPNGRLGPFGSEYMLRACGYRATATDWIGGACRNWIRQVRSKAEVAQ